MKYKNVKTGAVLDSPFNIRGKNWELVKHNQEGEVVSGDEEVPTTKEYVEEEVDLEAMTNQELDDFAKEHDISLSSDDKKNKTTRISAIAKAFE